MGDDTVLTESKSVEFDATVTASPHVNETSHHRSFHPSSTASSTTTATATAAQEKINIEALVRQARETDQKTIQELAKEVKRLTALLPRKLIEQEEDSIVHATEPTSTTTTTASSSSNLGKEKESAQPRTSTAAAVTTNSLKKKMTPTTASNSNNDNNATGSTTTTVNTGYNLLHVTIAMIFGALLMLAGLWNKVAA